MPARAAPRRRTNQRSVDTRRRILSTVHDLLAEGSFHEMTVEEVAVRAGVSRATLYQHFRSRLELIDAICDTMGENPALLELRGTVVLEDAQEALDATLALAVAFWASEDPVLEQLYGVTAVDPAARDFVARQRADRRREMERLARNLHRSGRLRAGLGERRALTSLMLLSSYPTYRELTAEGLTEREVTKALQEKARLALFDA